MNKPTSCDICGHPIVKDEDGQVVGHTYGNWILSLYERAAEESEIKLDEDSPVDVGLMTAVREGPLGPFVDQVTRCYFVQFRDFFEKPVKTMKGGHLVDSDDFVEKMMRRFEPDARLTEILKAFPEDKNVWMVVHDDCLPEGLQESGYQIPLDRIDSAEKAIEWTIQTSEKKQWHGPAWLYVLRQLFGRTPA
jgi:hypothetical protein